MPKFKLEGCKHAAKLHYGLSNSTRQTFTCLTCYQRLAADYAPVLDDFTVTVTPVNDFPPGPSCTHPSKKPVGEALTKHRDYTDAFCVDCGRVLRHPNGPGSWEEVLFYGYVIKEEPSW